MKTIEKIVYIKPMGAVRMNRGHAFGRGLVYLKWKIAIKEMVGKLPEGCPSHVSLIFSLPMAKSWSRKKREVHELQPHALKPDIDNMAKAVLDSLFKEDCKVSYLQASKRWASISDDYGSVYMKFIY